MVNSGSLDIFHHACQNIITAVDGQKRSTSLDWAYNYAKVGVTQNDIGNAVTQAYYILGNIQYWRGSIATETRNILKNFIKVNEEEGL